MEKVAALLKQARENKGVSLKEVEAATRIPTRYLEVLEGRKDTRFLADRLYLIPFLRNYATFLDINPETAVVQFINELQRIEVSTDHSEQPRELFRFSPWLVLLSLLVASLVIISFIWHRGGIHFSRQPTEEETPSMSSDLPPGPVAEPSTPPPSASSGDLPPGPVAEPSTPPPSASSGDLPSSSSAEPSAPTPSPSFSLASETPPLALSPQPSAIDQRTSHLLRVQAKETTWIRVIIDGEQEKDVLLQPGEKVEWSAQKGFVLTLGNAGGADLTFNGKSLPPLGISGQVIRDLQLPSPQEGGRG